VPEEVLPGPLTEAVDRIEHGVVVVDSTGAEIYRNTSARRIGNARDSRSLVESTLRRLLAAAAEGSSRREEVELFGPPAQLYVVSAHPFRHADGTGALAVVEDRSDSRRTETVRRDFVANISHELKTPVGALGLLAETIRGEDDPAVMQRLAGRMVTESERAARTIDDLLELSRIEFGDDAEFAPLDLVGVVGEAASRIATAAEQAGVTVQLDVPSDIAVDGDRRQLVSAVFNLLDNAVKYTAGGGEVRALRDAATSTVALSVEDEGIGIPRRSLDRIFERFYRVDRARSRNTGGTGLGLAIVRHVVNNHGGQVLAESVEGQGSVFTLLLPAASDALPADRLAPLEVHRG
jgi:two-component system sensor histidine kinase SenX3